MIKSRMRSNLSMRLRPEMVQMAFHFYFFLSMISLTLASSFDNVYITSSYNQLVTSSSLRWVNTDSTSSFSSDDRTVVRVGSTAVCRGWYQNQLVAGGTDPKGRCSVTFFETRQLLENFQVLVDTTSTSRLEWQKWDIFTKRPFGVVAFSDKALVARVKRPAGTSAVKPSKYVIGDLDPLRGLSGNIAVCFGDENTVEYVKEGEILMEIEPVRYELKHTVFIRERAKVLQEVVPLGNRVLVHPEPVTSEGEDEEETSENEIDDVTPQDDNDNERDVTHENWKEITSVIAYNATFHFYWGQLPGLIRTLPSSGETYDNHGRQDFKWGLPLDFTRHRIRDISHRLLEGTSLNVTAVAIKQTTEVPYTAVLVSLFADGRTKERSIESTYQETVFSDVEVSHDVPYFTKNGSATPTTTSAPTTTLLTTSGISNSSDDITGTPFPTRIIYLKPLRTTTPMPTSANPLLRFYPQSGSKEDPDTEEVEDSKFDDYEESRNKKVGKHNTRSSPMSDRWMKDGMSGASRLTSEIITLTLLSLVLSRAFV